MESIPVPEKVYGIIVEMASDLRSKVHKEYVEARNWDGPAAIRAIGERESAEKISLSGLVDKFLGEAFRIETEEEKELRLNPEPEEESQLPHLDDDFVENYSAD